jgi:hypothetical protein
MYIFITFSGNVKDENGIHTSEQNYSSYDKSKDTPEESDLEVPKHGLFNTVFFPQNHSLGPLIHT